jgi:hypothetical protein
MLRIAFVAAALLVAQPALAQQFQTPEEVDTRIDTILKNHVPYEAAYVDIRAALESNNPDALAEYITFGTPFLLNGKRVTLKDAAEFKARIGEFFNDKVKKAVEAQTYETLFVNADGVMFGTGQLWLHGICPDEACATFTVKVSAFNNG